MPILQISILRDGTFEGTELMHHPRFTIGRDSGSGVVLDDASCAGLHARVSVENGHVQLEDLGSALGTHVNGNRLNARCALSARDDVAIGGYTLKFKLLTERVAAHEGQPPAPAARTPAPAPPAALALSTAQTVVGAVQTAEEARFVPLPDTLPSAADAPFSFDLLASDFEDDDDILDEEPWSLAQHLARPQPTAGRDAVLELIHVRGETVIDHRLVRRGQAVDLPLHVLVAVGAAADRAAVPSVRFLASGAAELRLVGACSGEIVRAGVALPVAEAGAAGRVTLTDGETAILEMGGDRVFIAFAPAPRLLWSPEEAAAERAQRRVTAAATAASVGVIACAGAAAWVQQFRNQEQTVVVIEPDREVVLPPIVMSPPQPELQPEAAPERRQPTPAAEPAAPRTPRAPAAARAPSGRTAPSVLAALPAVHTDRVRDALARASAGIGGVAQHRGDFKLGDLVSRGSTTIGLPSGGDGPITTGINKLLRENGGAGALKGRGPHDVRGVVVGGAKPTVKPSGGTLSKEEIQRVIAKHLHEIQFCYEKALRTQPSLAGRVALEWTIGLSGRVTRVRTAETTLASDAAVNCMTSAVKTWTFAEPRGGEVIVAFPFTFNAL